MKLKEIAKNIFPFIPESLGPCQSFVIHDGASYLMFRDILYRVDGETLVDVETIPASDSDAEQKTD